MSTLEIYHGTSHGTSMYVEFDSTNFKPLNYIFRNRTISEYAYTIPVDIHNIDSTFSGEIHLGAFFNTDVTIIYEDGSANSFRFTYMPTPLHTPEPTPRPIHTERSIPAVRTNIPTQSNNPISDMADNMQYWHVALFACVLVICFFITMHVKKVKLNKLENEKNNWKNTFETIKKEAEQARIDRGWLPEKPIK